MKAYRVENQEKGHGIWRDFDGTVNPVFKHLSQGKCKDMPMPDSDFYRYQGKKWFSATDTPEKLKAWFSALDVFEMQKLGYSVYEFDISDCRIVSEYEICFTRDSVVSQKRIDAQEIYGEEYRKLIEGAPMRDKQIEDIKREVNIALARDCSKGRCLTCEFINEDNCEPSIIADHLYNKGYRKASHIVENIFGEIFALCDNAEEKLDILFTKADDYRKGYENSVKHFRSNMEMLKKKYESEGEG